MRQNDPSLLSSLNIPEIWPPVFHCCAPPLQCCIILLTDFFSSFGGDHFRRPLLQGCKKNHLRGWTGTWTASVHSDCSRSTSAVIFPVVLMASIRSQAVLSPSISQGLLHYISVVLSVFVFWGHAPGQIDHVALSTSPSDPCTPLAGRQDHPSASLLLSHTHLCFDNQRCFLLFVQSFYKSYLPIHASLSTPAQTHPPLLFVELFSVFVATHGDAKLSLSTAPRINAHSQNDGIRSSLASDVIGLKAPPSARRPLNIMHGTHCWAQLNSIKCTSLVGCSVRKWNAPHALLVWAPGTSSSSLHTAGFCVFVAKDFL